MKKILNARVKELAIQAGMVMYPTGIGIHENTIWGDVNIQKFAELIMIECAGVLDLEFDSKNEVCSDLNIRVP